jgi:hypothetical protein
MSLAYSILKGCDAVLMVESELNVFAEVVSAYGREVSVKKVKVLVVQPRYIRCHVEVKYRMQAEAYYTNLVSETLEFVSETKGLRKLSSCEKNHSAGREEKGQIWADRGQGFNGVESLAVA